LRSEPAPSRRNRKEAGSRPARAGAIWGGAHGREPGRAAAEVYGHERDELDLGGQEGDLDYMHARFCSSQLSRFLSNDPQRRLRPSSGRQSWNRFAYALGNPMGYTDPTGLDVIYQNAVDKEFYEKAAKRNYRVRGVLGAFAPGTGRDLMITRGNPGEHPTTHLPLAAKTSTVLISPEPDDAVRAAMGKAYDAAGGGKAGEAAAEKILENFKDNGYTLKSATIILTDKTTKHEKLHELGHVEQALVDPNQSQIDGEQANKALTDDAYKKSNSELYAENFYNEAKKKRPTPP